MIRAAARDATHGLYRGGREISRRRSFFDVLLGDKPPIAPEDRFYQRLLAEDEDEVTEIAEAYLAKKSLGETYDNLVIPAVRLADEDYHRGVLPEQRRQELLAQVNSLIADLGEALPAANTEEATGEEAEKAGKRSEGRREAGSGGDPGLRLCGRTDRPDADQGAGKHGRHEQADALQSPRQ